MNKETYFSTEIIDTEFKTEIWRGISQHLYEVSSADSEGRTPLEGSIRTRVIGSLFLGTVAFNNQIYHRNRARIIKSGLEDYMLQMLLTGAVVADCDGQSISAGPGDICLLDLSRTLNSKVCTGSTILAILPRSKLAKIFGGARLHGMVLKAEHPITRLLADYMIGLSRTSLELNVEEADSLEDAAISLLAAALSGLRLHKEAASAGIGFILRERVLQFIEYNLALPDLGPDLLMRRFNVSRAHLYRMFISDGGIAKVIREKRLEAAYLQLIHPSNKSKSITEIAHEYCFSSNSQFLRAFRNRFDVTPTDVKRDISTLRLPVTHITDTQLRLSEYIDGITTS